MKDRIFTGNLMPKPNLVKDNNSRNHLDPIQSLTTSMLSDAYQRLSEFEILIATLDEMPVRFILGVLST